MKHKNPDILKELRQLFQDLYGNSLVDMVLYGSYARDEAEDGSDIDILVVLKSNINPMEEIKNTGKIVSSLSLKYNMVISCVFMEEERYLHRNGPLLRNIRKEGIHV